MAPTRRTNPDSQIFVATDSFAAEVDGEVIVAHKGQTRVRAGHPLLVGREHLFEPIDAHVQYEVEQATAAPGERRGAVGGITNG